MPLFGGLLVPNPDVVLGVATDPLGRATLTLTVPSSLPSGFGLWLQGWFLDVSLPQYFSASNAMTTTNP